MKLSSLYLVKCGSRLPCNTDEALPAEPEHHYQRIRPRDKIWLDIFEDFSRVAIKEEKAGTQIVTGHRYGLRVCSQCRC